MTIDDVSQKIKDWFSHCAEGNAHLISTITFNTDTGVMIGRPAKMRIEPIFRWYDFWVGVFVDTKRRRIYIFPIPMLGIQIYWG